MVSRHSLTYPLNPASLDGLLALARSQASTGTCHRVDLATIAAIALNSVELTVRADLRPAPVSGKPVLLERMCGNLIDNAVRHNHLDGHMEVITGIVDGRAFLRVGNIGALVPSDAVDQLREPFVRGNGARIHTDRGIGPGLSIVDAVVETQEACTTSTSM